MLITCIGQNRLFRNTGKGTFIDVTRASGLAGKQGFSTSALWFDFDGDGLLDLFVCNYVKWSAEHDVFCSLDGKHKSYCTPEAYRGETCWLFRNRGDGTFEDVTATSRIFDTSSKSLGVTLLDHDQDRWPDLLVTNDTQPNKLYQNMRDGGYRTPALWLSEGWEWVGRERIEEPLYWHDDGTEFTLAGRREIDLAAPVAHVSYFEADAFARWSGARLPTEAEWEDFAASADPMIGNQLDCAGAAVPRPGGGMLGDVWEWTRSAFASYPGFATAGGAVGEYNGKFMCGQFVLKGASCATPRGHSRASYRNFFPPTARWQFTGVRLAKDA